MKTASFFPSTTTQSSSSSAALPAWKTSTPAAPGMPVPHTHSIKKNSETAAVDAYAQGLLEQHAVEQSPDSSLGSYVTSLLRTSRGSPQQQQQQQQQQQHSVRYLEEFESLVELVQEHCNMTDENNVVAVLEDIAQAVWTGRVPSTMPPMPPPSHYHGVGGQYSYSAYNAEAGSGAESRSYDNSGLATMHVLSDALRMYPPVPSYDYSGSVQSNFHLSQDHFPSLQSTTATASGGASQRPQQPQLPPLNTAASSATPTSSRSSTFHNTAVSPLHADRLIPHDLMGALDAPSSSTAQQQQQPKQQQQQQKYFSGRPSNNSTHNARFATTIDSSAFPPLALSASSTSTNKQKTLPTDDKDEFPPLGAAQNSTSTQTSKRKTSKAPFSKSNAYRSSEASELVAALFRPSPRSRQSSIDESHSTAATNSNSSSSGSPHLHPENPANFQQQQLQHAYQSSFNQGNFSQQQQHFGGDGSDYFGGNLDAYHQQPPMLDGSQPQSLFPFENTVEILLSMNPDISEEAAQCAAGMSASVYSNAGCDINIAQYLIDTSMNAVPICRHLMGDGCYRADCHFSHDVNNHTCVFWLRKRCAKGPNQCRFLHGFNPDLLDDILNNYPSPSQQHAQQELGEPGVPSELESYGGYPPGSYDVDSNSGFPPSSFANVASQGYDNSSSFYPNLPVSNATNGIVPTVKIPQDLWNAHENRDSSVFYIPDPLERYRHVAATVPRQDIVDLHFQSTKTFAVVLENILYEKLQRFSEVWIVTGTGHHVGTRTHQKGGGALESAVLDWLSQNAVALHCNYFRGKDRNGQTGAILVQRQQ